MIPQRPVVVIVNPLAARGGAAVLAAAMRERLAALAPAARLELPQGVAAARALAAAQPPGTRIVVVGGDGTLQALLPVLAQRDCEVGLVALGSGNDTARAVGLRGLAWPRALQHALDAPALPIDLGECVADGRRELFASSLTAGFDSAVGMRALRAPRWLRGLPRYLWATLAELAALRRWPVAIEADGERVVAGEVLFASVLNTPTYGGGMPVAPDARIADDRLDLIVAAGFGRLGAAAMLPRLLAGRHLPHPRIATRSFALLAATSSVEVPLAADGEPIVAARAWRVRVLPAALRVAGRGGAG
ncbi:MAG: diacylglycerol kinase family lipid kinase [Burkholderiaceae bacterium]|nr:diacylglycerol kinase family lipid kinase [Burkholderiaceae bacterium]